MLAGGECSHAAGIESRLLGVLLATAVASVGAGDGCGWGVVVAARELKSPLRILRRRWPLWPTVIAMPLSESLASDICCCCCCCCCICRCMKAAPVLVALLGRVCGRVDARVAAIVGGAGRSKFLPRWTGPVVIVRIVCPVTYMLKPEVGPGLERKVHLSDLNPWFQSRKGHIEGDENAKVQE